MGLLIVLKTIEKTINFRFIFSFFLKRSFRFRNKTMGHKARDTRLNFLKTNNKSNKTIGFLNDRFKKRILYKTKGCR